LEEVVVVGYGTTKKATVTGSVSSVGGEKLQSSASTNLTSTLSGVLPGLVVVNRNGEPGNDDALLQIRGSNTLGNNSPLVVVDGIPNRDLGRINSADIESITVLKDASAAIYGAQAANGVILVITKRGVVGKPEVSVSVNQGWSSPTVLPKMADAPTYAQMTNEINLTKGLAPAFTAAEIQKFSDGSDPWLYPNTDWFGETYKSFSRQNNVNFKLTGGSDRLKYYFSAGYKFQDGNYKNSATNYSQENFRSNIDGKITDNIKLSLDISGRQENRNYPTQEGGNIYNSCLISFPTLPAWWPNGLPGPDIEAGRNPVVQVTDQTGYDKDIRYIMESNAKLDINIPWVKGLSLTANVAFDKNLQNHKLWQTPWTLYSWDRTTYDTDGIPVLLGGKRGYSEPRLSQSLTDGHRTTLNALINYEHKFGNNHNFKFLAGAEKIAGESMSFSAYRRYYVSTVSQELFAGGDLEKDNSGSSNATARLNYFGRVNYNYSEKYLAEFVWRYDGSYIFPASHRFGFFPGVSLGWRISEEDFWKDKITAVKYLKIRGSWGQTGNDLIEPYQYLSSYGFGSPYILNHNVESKTMYELRVPNESVTWEVANQTNIGFDSQIGEKITFTADYFYNLRTNILWWRNASVPASTGLSLPRENIGEVLNKGFEIVVGYKDHIGDFNYQLSVNGAFQKNSIKFWDETPGVPEYQKSTGHPMNSNLYYQAIGIFKDQAAVDAYPHWALAQPGDVIFKDVNNDLVIDALDRVRNDKTDLPKFTGGATISLTYKNFYSTILLQGAAGAAVYYYPNCHNFLQSDADGRWTEDNINATKHRVEVRDAYWITQVNTYNLKNTNYLRLKNIEVGYTLPESINRKLGLKETRVYFSGLNILTFTKLKDFDPEINNFGYVYPPTKVSTIGISLTF
jgi:TonB-dependent starch-binding outer membrane protein SusC